MTVPEPPTYGGDPQLPFSPTHAVAWGWLTFTQFLGPVMIGVAIYVAFNGAIALLGGIVSAFTSIGGELGGSETRSAFEAGNLAYQFTINAASWIGSVVLSGGAARAALDVADGRGYDFVDACRRVPVLKLFVATLLIGLVTVIVLLALVVPFVLAGVFLNVSLWLLVPIGIALFLAFAVAATAFQYLLTLVIVDERDLSVNGAIGSSLRIVRDNVANTVGLSLLLALVMLAGLLACLVGVFVAFPIAMFAAANAYRSFQGRLVAP